MQGTKYFIGSFESISGKFAISDPCYEVGVWCRGELDKVKLGKWKGYTVEADDSAWGKRVASLTAIHEDYDGKEGSLTVKVAEFEVGVDSGTAGIFDAAHYRDDSLFPNETPTDESGEVWYGHAACGVWEEKHFARVIPYGITSTSGYGDGGYSCSYSLNADNEVVKVEVVFISEDGDDEDDEE